MNHQIKHTAADQQDESKRNFALLSHDLRSALAGVMGSLELIDEQTIPAEARGNIIRAKASSRMLHELLDLAFDMGKDISYMRNANIKVDPAKELRVIADIWGMAPNGTGPVVRLDLPENLPVLDSTDKVSFHRILNNLVGNAHKFSDDGLVRVSVSYDDGQTLKISVIDGGPGFSKAALERIFQFRGRPEDSEKPGSGMGLYIVNTLVRSMGGTVTAGNTPTGGARVEMVFPVEQAFDTAAAARVDELPDLSNLNILLAEDNITNQLVVTQMLKSMGARFVVASDGVEAIEAFEEGEFDVVLLDIEMPRKSGLEVLREIRSRSDAKSATPLVALTAYVMHEHRERIEKAGADGIIAKPIEGISALGKSILGFMYGTTPKKAGQAASSGTLSTFDGDVGDIDMQVFEALINTIGPDTKAEFLEKVTIDLEDMRIKLIEAEANADITAIRAASHTLVSVGGSIGAANLQQCAEALNLAVKTEGQVNRQSLNMQCIKGISEVLAFLATQ